jgi:hypothetical protein
MEDAKQLAIRILKSLGYRAESIPESADGGGKRADIAADGDGDRYIIEVKHRFEDPVQRKAMNERLANGELVSTAESLCYSARVDAILRHGLKQIDETPKAHGTFNLLWFHAEGMDADLKARRARNTFYGLVHLLPRPLDSPGAEETQCFYFDHNTSIRLPTVHGLVIVDGEGLQLCINEFSDRAFEFRKSSLVAKLGTAVIDPVSLESSGEAIVLRSNVRRSDETLVLQKIYELTGNRYISIRLNRHAVSAVIVPRSDE